MVSVLFITFVICLFIGVPVAFSLGLASLAYFLGANMPIATFSQRFFAGIDSFTLLCIPGFTLAGNLMNQGGISDKLMDFCDKLVGHLTGGMAYANIMASMIFAGISGTALSDTVALGGIEIPMMVDLGYDKSFSVAVTAASSCMGPIIPPSLPMIMAATMTGLSVSKMFMAGIVPGILTPVTFPPTRENLVAGFPLTLSSRARGCAPYKPHTIETMPFLVLCVECSNDSTGPLCAAPARGVLRWIVLFWRA